MTTIKKILSTLLLFFFIFSCENSNKKDKNSNYNYDLEISANYDLKVPINENTAFSFSSLFPYFDKSGKEYLTFRSTADNSILFHDFETGKYLFDIKLDLEGPNGVGRFTGYHIEDMNSIYITSYQKMGIVEVDTTGTIKKFIEYGKTDKGYNVVPSYKSNSLQYTPLIIHNNIFYITQMPWQGSKIKDTPVSVAIDTLSNTFKELPLRFPNLLTEEEYPTTLTGLDFSRDFNGKQFIYSFYMDENIYITDIETDKEIKIPIKSKHINGLIYRKRPEDQNTIHKTLIESSYYGNLLYDKYRNVYYRFARIGAEPPSEYKELFSEIYFSGAIQFSVIIIDKDFNIIGETLLPKYTYNPTIAFVHKNGLYISDSHILNPSFDENVLSFKCFTLKKNK